MNRICTLLRCGKANGLKRHSKLFVYVYSVIQTAYKVLIVSVLLFLQKIFWNLDNLSENGWHLVKTDFGIILQ